MKDVDGDGRIDVFCRLIEMPFSQVVWFDSSRKQVWMRSDFPQVRATRAACQSSTSTATAGMRVSSSGTLNDRKPTNREPLIVKKNKKGTP